jgi:drug/metabolite transporter (DMT)-like permease
MFMATSSDRGRGDRVRSSGSGSLGGAALMLAAGALFATMDGTAKLLTSDYPVLEVAWARYAFHLLLMAPLLRRQGAARLVASRRPVLQMVRSALLLACTVLFFLAIRRMPLADATALGFTAPLFVTLLSPTLLSEQVGPRRWAAVILGFLGVVAVVRPGSAVLDWPALLPVLVALFFALYQITTRILGAHDGAFTTLFYTTLAGIAVLSLAQPFIWVAPDLRGWLLMALLGGVGGVAHFAMIRAYALAEASLLAPLGYLQLVWATAIGFALFGDLPDSWTIGGGALIAGGGLYTVYRERTRRPSRDRL